jgi:hypothetical protein
MRQGPNLYEYVGNDPANRSDSSGLYWGPAWGPLTTVSWYLPLALSDENNLSNACDDLKPGQSTYVKTWTGLVVGALFGLGTDGFSVKVSKVKCGKCHYDFNPYFVPSGNPG